MKYIVRTLGCKSNLADSQQIEAELQRRGWLPASQKGEAKLCVINSCTVTDEADRQSRKLAQRISSDHPDAFIVMTGCAAEVDPELMSKSRGIHAVIGNHSKPKLVDSILERLNSSGGAAESTLVIEKKQMLSRHLDGEKWLSLSQSFETPNLELSRKMGINSKTRVFLRIQEGCNSFCTYCVIPYGRGPSRSLELPTIVQQVRSLIEQGVREIVITGTNIGDYGGGPSALEELLLNLLEKTTIERIRVSSLSPVEITPGILKIMKDSARFCPHFHVSLQSGSDRILRGMKRNYKVKDIESCLSAIGELSESIGPVFVGMDVITGFPTESVQDFQDTLTLLEKLPWSRLHVFPFSERKGTPASRMTEVVPQHERILRAGILGELSMKKLHAWHESVIQKSASQLTNVLGERIPRGPELSEGKYWVGGYTPHYLRVLAPVLSSERQAALVNQLFSARAQRLVVDKGNADVIVIGELIQ